MTHIPVPTPPSDSFEEFYRFAHPRLVASLTLALGNVDTARDAAADAFTKALADWPRVRNLRSPTGWTYTVALNSARRHLSRRQKEQSLLRRYPAPDAHELPEAISAVWEEIRHLPDRQRLAVVLRYGADLTEADIAKAMRIRRSTVSSTLAAAHKTLGRLLELPGPLEQSAHFESALQGDPQ